MSINYSTFKNDREGILFNERLYQTPVRKDIWDAAKKRIPARNMIVAASTGGGKSVVSLNIIQQCIEQNYKLIVVEFGKSFTSFHSFIKISRCILIMTALLRWV